MFAQPCHVPVYLQASALWFRVSADLREPLRVCFGFKVFCVGCYSRAVWV